MTNTRFHMMTSLIIGSALIPVSASFAFVPKASITKNTIAIYGAYTTSDPTCQTGLQPTLALSKTYSGGSIAQNICSNNKSIVWPDKIRADATAVGLTLTSTCVNSASDVVPVFISTNAALGKSHLRSIGMYGGWLSG